MMRPATYLLVLLLAGSAHAADRELKQRLDAVRAQVEKARRANAKRCAPVELATADANLQFAIDAADAGDGRVARSKLARAESAARKALEQSADCSPKRVTIRLPPPARTASGGGADRDADGLPDELDRCPMAPEDKDGFQDEDGCPEADNDGDGVLDMMDACPSEPGAAGGNGCP